MYKTVVELGEEDINIGPPDGWQILFDPDKIM
jgi:hypothetical protein